MEPLKWKRPLRLLAEVETILIASDRVVSDDPEARKCIASMAEQRNATLEDLRNAARSLGYEIILSTARDTEPAPAPTSARPRSSDTRNAALFLALLIAACATKEEP